MTAAERLHAAQFSPRIVSGAVHADFLANEENAWPTEAAAAVSELLSAAESPEERRSLARHVIMRHQAECEAAAMVGNDEKKEAAEFLKAQCEAVVTRSTGGYDVDNEELKAAKAQVMRWYHSKELKDAPPKLSGTHLHEKLQTDMKAMLVTLIMMETDNRRRQNVPEYKLQRTTIDTVQIVRAILAASEEPAPKEPESKKNIAEIREAGWAIEALHRLWSDREDYARLGLGEGPSQDQKDRSKAMQELYDIERFFQEQAQQEPNSGQKSRQDADADWPVLIEGPKGAATFDHPLFHRDPEPLRRVDVETPLVLCGDPTVTEALVAEPTGLFSGGPTCRGELGCGKEKPPLSDFMREILRGMGFFAVDQEDRYPQDGDEGDDETAVRKIVDKYEHLQREVARLAEELKHGQKVEENYENAKTAYHNAEEKQQRHNAELEAKIDELKRKLDVAEQDVERTKKQAEVEADRARAQQKVEIEKAIAKTRELEQEAQAEARKNAEAEAEEKTERIKTLIDELETANEEIDKLTEKHESAERAQEETKKNHQRLTEQEHQRYLKLKGEIESKAKLLDDHRQRLAELTAQGAAASAAADARLRKAEADSAEALRSARAEARASQDKNEVRMQAAERRISQAIVAANAAIEAGEAASARAELAKALEETQAEARRTKAEARETVRESKTAPRPLNMATFTSALAAKFSASQPGAYTF